MPHLPSPAEVAAYQRAYRSRVSGQQLSLLELKQIQALARDKLPLAPPEERPVLLAEIDALESVIVDHADTPRPPTPEQRADENPVLAWTIQRRELQAALAGAQLRLDTAPIGTAARLQAQTAHTKAAEALAAHQQAHPMHIDRERKQELLSRADAIARSAVEVHDPERLRELQDQRSALLEQAAAVGRPPTPPAPEVFKQLDHRPAGVERP
jgi:hypothetical protein